MRKKDACLKPFQSELFPSDYQCFICLEVPVKPGQCPSCFKLVCLPCIFSWLGNNPVCPHCKQPIRDKQILIPAQAITKFCILYNEKVKVCVKHPQQAQTLFCRQCRKLCCEKCCLFHPQCRREQAIEQSFRVLWESLMRVQNLNSQGSLKIQSYFKESLKQLKKERDLLLHSLQKYYRTIESEINSEFELKQKGLKEETSSLFAQFKSMFRERASLEAYFPRLTQQMVLSNPQMFKGHPQFQLPTLKKQMFKFQTAGLLSPPATRIQIQFPLNQRECWSSQVQRGIRKYILFAKLAPESYGLSLKLVAKNQENRPERRFQFKFSVFGEQSFSRSSEAIMGPGEQTLGYDTFIQRQNWERVVGRTQNLRAVVEFRQVWFRDYLLELQAQLNKKQRRRIF